jgi:hypothetical protein
MVIYGRGSSAVPHVSVAVQYCRGPGSVIYLVPFRQMFHDDFKCVGMTLSSIPLQLLNIDLT